MEPPTVPAAGEPPPSAEPASVLARIDAREREIERALRDARETAGAIVQEARDRAEALAAAQESLRAEQQRRAEADELLARLRSGFSAEQEQRSQAEALPEQVATLLADTEAYRARETARAARAAAGGVDAATQEQLRKLGYVQ